MNEINSPEPIYTSSNYDTPVLTQRLPYNSKEDIEAIRSQFLALKCFVMDQLHEVKNMTRSSAGRNMKTAEDNVSVDVLRNQILDQKNELASKDLIIKSLLEIQKQTMHDQTKILLQAKNFNLIEKTRDPKKSVKKKTSNPFINGRESLVCNKNRFGVLTIDDSGNDVDVNEFDDVVNDVPKTKSKSYRKDGKNVSKTNSKSYPKGQHNKPTTVILSDSICKDVFGYKLSNSLDGKENIVVKMCMVIN